MPEHIPFRRSIFFRLFLVMVAAALAIFAVVAGLFVTVVGRSLHPVLADPANHALVRSAHTHFLTLALLLVLSVIVAAHEVIRRSLRPLRSLQAGVERLREGELDVVLPPAGSSELGALTRAFNEMGARVREMVTARETLLRDVSHELRSPLTRMKVALALLPEGEKRSRMEADVAEMEALVAQLLELERLRGPSALRLERKDLVPLLRAAVDAVRDEKPGARLEAPEGELLARFDTEKVRTVMSNLLGNAMKYALADSAKVVVSAAREGDWVVVRVRDDGPGIPPEDRASIFAPFYRVDRSRSKRTGGYGLGLAICRGIMEAHGGGIALEETSGRGACFVLRFPVAPA